MSKFISNFIQSSKISSGSIECFLAEHHRKFHECLKSFPIEVQKNQVLGFSLKRFFLRKISWPREMQILKPYTFFAKSQKIPRSSSETAKLYSQKIIFSSKNSFFGRHKLHFWQPSSKIVSQNPKNFTHKVRKHKGSKYLLIHFFSGQKNALLKIFSKNRTKSFIFFRSRPEIIKQN